MVTIVEECKVVYFVFDEERKVPLPRCETHGTRRKVEQYYLQHSAPELV